MPRSRIQDQLSHVRPVWEPFLPDWRQVILAARVRLTRNLSGTPFPLKAGADELRHIASTFSRRLRNCSALRGGPHGAMDRLKPGERELLVERRLVEPGFAHGGSSREFAASRTHHLVVTVNDEDHLRVQATLPGLALQRAWGMASGMVTHLGEGGPGFAFDPRLGFLTSDPGDLGTGLRASVMVHLPALAWRGEMVQVRQALAKLGATVQGAFGAGGEAWGDLYEIANASTLGESEDGLIGRLEGLVLEVVRHERDARLSLVRRESVLFYDHVGRSYGILCFSRLLTVEEALGGISALVTGLRVGLLPKVNLDTLNRLLLEVQPGHLRSSVVGDQEPATWDAVRAQRVREALSAASRR